MISAQEVLDLLAERGALRSGHFLLSSGNHSDTYVEKARILEDPAIVTRLAEEIGSWFEGVDTVASPAVGAIPLGFAVAQQLTARFVYAERTDDRLLFRRGFSFRKGERTLVVEDVITTGGSVGELLGLVREVGADPIGVAALIDRSVGDPSFHLRALARVEANVFRPESCPLCDQELPLESPGSRHG
ncbi:MAG: orotate phosphoribosyltransferase [Actinomycetota bacterium]